MKNRVKVVICGKTYTIQTEESSSYVTKLAKDLDARINSFMNENTSVSVTAAAVVVGLDLMDEMSHAIEDVDHIRGQIKGYVEEASAARMQLEQLQRENNALKKELAALKKELEQPKSEVQA